MSRSNGKGLKLLTIGSTFGNSIGLRSHLDLPTSVEIFRNDRRSSIKRINNAIETAKNLEVAAQQIVSEEEFKKYETISKFKAEAKAIEDAKKLVSQWQRPVEQNALVEIVYNTGDEALNFGRFELRKVVAAPNPKNITVAAGGSKQ